MCRRKAGICPTQRAVFLPLISTVHDWASPAASGVTTVLLPAPTCRENTILARFTSSVTQQVTATVRVRFATGRRRSSRWPSRQRSRVRRPAPSRAHAKPCSNSPKSSAARRNVKRIGIPLSSRASTMPPLPCRRASHTIGHAAPREMHACESAFCPGWHRAQPHFGGAWFHRCRTRFTFSVFIGHWL